MKRFYVLEHTVAVAHSGPQIRQIGLDLKIEGTVCSKKYVKRVFCPDAAPIDASVPPAWLEVSGAV